MYSYFSFLNLIVASPRNQIEVSKQFARVNDPKTIATVMIHLI